MWYDIMNSYCLESDCNYLGDSKIPLREYEYEVNRLSGIRGHDQENEQFALVYATPLRRLSIRITRPNSPIAAKNEVHALDIKCFWFLTECPSDSILCNSLECIELAGFDDKHDFSATVLLAIVQKFRCLQSITCPHVAVATKDREALNEAILHHPTLCHFSRSTRRQQKLLTAKKERLFNARCESACSVTGIFPLLLALIFAYVPLYDEARFLSTYTR
jgi:hypothetical protein